MKKKLISILLVVLAVCFLTACTARAPVESAVTQNNTEVTQDITQTDGTTAKGDTAETETTSVPGGQTVTEQKNAETPTDKKGVEPAKPVTTKSASSVTTKHTAETTTKKSTVSATTQKRTTEPTTAKKPTPTTKAPTTQKAKPATTVHQHTYKAVYREEPVYEEQPRYKCVQHAYCSVCGLDFTELARKNGTDGLTESAKHLSVHPHTGKGKLVEELIGYEKVQVGTKKVIDHYECTGCGAVKK